MYVIFIVASFIFFIIYSFFKLKKYGISKLLLSYIIIICFVLIGGKFFTMIVEKRNFYESGLSSYGGVIGMLFGSFLVSKMYKNVDFFIVDVLSLPAMYSISKLGCFFTGCCFGIPYDGIFSVYYRGVYFNSVLPIQLLETVSFAMIFLFLNKFYNKKKSLFIIEYTIIISAAGKFFLDFLRFSHLGQIMSANQIVSLVLIVICIFLIIFRRSKYEKSN